MHYAVEEWGEWITEQLMAVLEEIGTNIWFWGMEIMTETAIGLPTTQ